MQLELYALAGFDVVWPVQFGVWERGMRGQELSRRLSSVLARGYFGKLNSHW